MTSIKVPTKKTESIISGVVTLCNAAEIHTTMCGGAAPQISITQSIGRGNCAWINAAAARQAASFFTNLANILEGKEQQ